VAGTGKCGVKMPREVAIPSPRRADIAGGEFASLRIAVNWTQDMAEQLLSGR